MKEQTSSEDHDVCETPCYGIRASMLGWWGEDSFKLLSRRLYLYILGISSLCQVEFKKAEFLTVSSLCLSSQQLLKLLTIQSIALELIFKSQIQLLADRKREKLKINWILETFNQK